MPPRNGVNWHQSTPETQEAFRKAGAWKRALYLEKYVNPVHEEPKYTEEPVVSTPEVQERTPYEKLQDSLVRYLSGLSVPTLKTKKGWLGGEVPTDEMIKFENNILNTYQTDRETVRSALDIIAHDPMQPEDIKSKAGVVLAVIRKQIAKNWSRTATLKGGRRSRRRKARRARRTRRT
jgi:hypothetical protein